MAGESVRQKTRLKQGDTVKVIAGKEKGKSGRLLRIDHKNGRVVVEGLNMIKRHQRATALNRESGIIEREASIHISNVMYLDGDVATRVRKEVTPEGKRARTAVRSGKRID